MGMAQGLLTVRAFEAAAKAKGGKGVTGADVRDALLSQSFPSESFFGVLPAMKFGTDAPFPTQGNSVNIGTVEKGKYRLKQASVPVPAVNKW
jgi:branched-chain amino acid transport system substrate-binding protein